MSFQTIIEEYKMKAVLALVVTLIATVLLGAAVAFFSYVSANNYGVKVEAELKASRDNNQNILAQYQQRVLEAAQVPDMYKDDFKEVISASMTGRYGDNGSQAMFQWIKEHDINFDSKLYANLQDIIAGGRKDFENGQRKMLDIRKGYEAQLGYFWRGLWLRIAGFPKIDFKDYQPIVTDRVEEVFEKGKESSPLKLRG